MGRSTKVLLECKLPTSVGANPGSAKTIPFALPKATVD